MKKVFFLVTILLISVFVSAQSVDFSGSWKLNRSKSTLGDQFSMAPAEIVVAQKGNDLSVEKHSSFNGQDFTTNDKFTLDGKECVNAGWRDSQKKSTAVWTDKNTLKITTKVPMRDSGEMTITEVYKMDGGNMVIETSASSSYGDFSEKMVYDKI